MLWCCPRCVFGLNFHLPISTVATFPKFQILASIVTLDVLHRQTCIFPAVNLFAGWLHHVALLIVEARECCLIALVDHNSPVIICNPRSVLFDFYCRYVSGESVTIHFRLHIITLFKDVFLFCIGLSTSTTWRNPLTCQQTYQFL